MKKHVHPKIAIVHDSIRFFGGAERVLLSLHRAFLDADIFTSVISWEDIGPFAKDIQDLHIKTLWVQHIPLFRKYPFLFRYILPFVWSSLDLSSYDIIISASGAQMSHLVRKRKGAIHICYCHTPPRHLYGYKTDYPWEKTWIIYGICRVFNVVLRIINKWAIQDIDYFIANSKETARRIKKFYARSSVVIHPPVYVPKHILKGRNNEPYYLVVSRLSQMKHVDHIIQAANRLHIPLHIVGTGPEEINLRYIAGKTIVFLGQLSDTDLLHQYRNCQALICAAEDEDFGITPLEAMACGKPVLGYYSGGYKETIIPFVTGIFFYKNTPNAIRHALLESKRRRFNPSVIAQHVASFADTLYIRAMKQFVNAHTS